MEMSIECQPSTGKADEPIYDGVHCSPVREEELFVEDYPSFLVVYRMAKQRTNHVNTFAFGTTILNSPLWESVLRYVVDYIAFGNREDLCVGVARKFGFWDIVLYQTACVAEKKRSDLLCLCDHSVCLDISDT